ncbi:redoxin domain-containing protein [bacterium]|nr:redoxin domain-containing protein [bacterium]
MFDTSDVRPPRWLSTSIWLAASFNLLWGGWVALFPAHSFELLGITPPNYLSLWRCVGFIIALYGICYAMAAVNPVRFWPNVAVGMLGKLIGPVGFLFTALSGELPWSYGIHVIFCDLIWWIPFALTLRWSINAEWRLRDQQDQASAPDLATAFSEARDQQGRTLLELSQQGPQLLVFLRHLGCIFCGELMGDLQRGRASFEAAGLGLVFVHMGSEAEAQRRLAPFGLDDLPRISDPDRRIYRAFGLRRGQLGQLIGPAVIWRALQAFFKGAGINRAGRNMDQLPGIFIVQDGRIVKSFAARSAAMYAPTADFKPAGETTREELRRT